MRARSVLADGGAAVLAAVPPRVLTRLPRAPRRRAQLLLNRALKRHPRHFRSVRTSFGFTVDGRTDDLIQRYLYLFGVWEPNTTQWVREHLQPGDVVVDVGANIGYFSLLSASIVGPTGRVLAFEPVPSIADALEANVARNGLPVEVRRVAVGDEAGSIEVFRSRSTNIGRSGTRASDGAVSEGLVPVVRGSDAVPRELWSRTRLVKIDVEGDEGRVLHGLVPVLADLRPGAAVLTEVTPDPATPALLELMSGLGFDVLVLPNSYAAADYAGGRRHLPQPLVGVPATQTDVVFLKRSP